MLLQRGKFGLFKVREGRGKEEALPASNNSQEVDKWPKYVEEFSSWIHSKLKLLSCLWRTFFFYNNEINFAKRQLD